jgi:hypothetical protein
MKIANKLAVPWDEELENIKYHNNSSLDQYLR